MGAAASTPQKKASLPKRHQPVEKVAMHSDTHSAAAAASDCASSSIVKVGYIFSAPLCKQHSSDFSEASDGCRLDVEWFDIQKNRKIIQESVKNFAVEWHETIATMGDLEKLLWKGIDILHYVGHGCPGNDGEPNRVAFEDHSRCVGTEYLVSSEDLKRIRTKNKDPKVIIACGWEAPSAAQVLMEAFDTNVIMIHKGQVQKIHKVASQIYKKLLGGKSLKDTVDSIKESGRGVQLFSDISDKVTDTPFPSVAQCTKDLEKMLKHEKLSVEQTPINLHGRGRILQNLYASACSVMDNNASKVFLLYGEKGIGKASIAQRLAVYTRMRCQSSRAQSLNSFRHVLFFSLDLSENMDEELIKQIDKYRSKTSSADMVTDYAVLIVNIVYTVTTFGHSSAMQKFLAKISGLSGKHCIIVSASIGSAEPYQHINDTIEVNPVNDEASRQIFGKQRDDVRWKGCIKLDLNGHYIALFLPCTQVEKRLWEEYIFPEAKGNPLCIMNSADRVKKLKKDLDAFDFAAFARKDRKTCNHTVYKECDEAFHKILAFYQRLQKGSNTCRCAYEQVISCNESTMRMAIIEFIREYLSNLKPIREDEIRRMLFTGTVDETYTVAKGFKLYRWCLEVLMPFLWLLKYGVPTWWQCTDPQPLIYCQTPAEAASNCFYYRLSSSHNNAITCTVVNDASAYNIRICFVPFEDHFRFEARLDDTGKKSWWYDWHQVHSTLSNKTGVRFLSENAAPRSS